MTVPITLACCDYDRTRALMDGRVRPEGIDLTYLALEVEDTFWRMLQFLEFEAAEMSLSNYLIERTKDHPRFIAIPVFPARSFRHSFIFVNENAGIKSPQDLKGKRVGTPEYSMTAILWQRGMLQDDYGVKPSDMEWLAGGQESAGRKERIIHNMPAGVSIKPIGPDKTLSQMLASGEIDALLTARVPSCYGQPGAPVRRLFEDFAQVELDYYHKTKIFPMMHTVVIRNDIYEKYPWVGVNLLRAFSAAKELSTLRLLDTGSLAVGLPVLIPAIETTLREFGPDFWPYGVEANCHTLDKACQYSFEQGLSRRRLKVEELFVPSTYEMYKI